MESLLEGCRALDLTDEKGFLCGKILGDLGADVIKIEKPGGDPARNIGPFYKDTPHPEKSLFWFAYNNNKRGITLDIQTADGKELFKKLVETADFVIESFPPGYMDKLGLGYSTLKDINPRIIMTSISPFGQEGPYKDYKATDIVATALSGLMFLTGDADRAPVRVSFPQSYFHAGSDAAAGSLIAYYYRESSGEGQYVDVSMRESMVRCMLAARPAWDTNKIIVQRAGSFWKLLYGPTQRQHWRCKDGMVTFILMGGAGPAQSYRNLIVWMDGEGFADDLLKGINWDEFDLATTTQEFLDAVQERLNKFFMAHTKNDLFEEAIKRKVMLYPVSTAREIRESPQLAARNYWKELEHPELNTSIAYPAYSGVALENPCQLRRRAPLVGEHNEEVYLKEVGLTREEIVILKQAGVI